MLATPPAATAGVLRARFIGNMAFHVTDGSTSLLTDFPYEPGYAGYMRWTAEQVPTTKRHTLCLITHGHRDHFDRERFAHMASSVVGPRDVVEGFETRSLPMAPRIEYRGIVIEPMATEHGDREHYSYRVTWNELRLYFTGDTDDLEPLLREKDLDVAFVSPWLLEAARARGARIRARRVVVYHHAEQYMGPDYQGRALPKQGEELVLESAGPQPAGPTGRDGPHGPGGGDSSAPGPPARGQETQQMPDSRPDPGPAVLVLSRTRSMAATVIENLTFPNGGRFEAVIDDLLAESTDCIVNAANGGLSHGGGVAAAISAAAGAALDREGDEIVRIKGPVPVGDAVVTTAGKLPFKGVIHTVGPRLGEGDEEAKLARAMRSAFARAHEKGWRSLSFPAVSSGIFAVPLDVCARAYLEAVRSFFAEHPDSTLKLIRLCVYKGPIADVLRREMTRP